MLDHLPEVIGAAFRRRPWPARRRKVVVPDFCGRLASERSLIAVQAGVRTRCHSTTLQPTGDGIVVGQDPPAGTVVRRATEVVLTVMHAPADVER